MGTNLLTVPMNGNTKRDSVLSTASFDTAELRDQISRFPSPPSVSHTHEELPRSDWESHHKSSHRRTLQRRHSERTSLEGHWEDPGFDKGWWATGRRSFYHDGKMRTGSDKVLPRRPSEASIPSIISRPMPLQPNNGPLSRLDRELGLRSRSSTTLASVHMTEPVRPRSVAPPLQSSSTYSLVTPEKSMLHPSKSTTSVKGRVRISSNLTSASLPNGSKYDRAPHTRAATVPGPSTSHASRTTRRNTVDQRDVSHVSNTASRSPYSLPKNKSRLSLRLSRRFAGSSISLAPPDAQRDFDDSSDMQDHGRSIFRRISKVFGYTSLALNLH
ncbi:hypothetical protein SISNIDRAFT_487727 [Sistotremastrum niveocremeum HHB9708]|uniref:Uncharacterized protein n=1 Tax=Sistotremastrum niveocremeum HHB9708 TaxID=1314777 RepID=A0A164RZX9_9AGAM|nr:hypothetical protein SISNIDRAFT_487727 [Sistotremastrum niveocremeum HHB9708]